MLFSIKTATVVVQQQLKKYIYISTDAKHAITLNLLQYKKLCMVLLKSNVTKSFKHITVKQQWLSSRTWASTLQWLFTPRLQELNIQHSTEQYDQFNHFGWTAKKHFGKKQILGYCLSPIADAQNQHKRDIAIMLQSMTYLAWQKGSCHGRVPFDIT